MAVVSPRLSASRSSPSRAGSPARGTARNAFVSSSRSRSISPEPLPQTKPIAVESVTLRVENLTRNVTADHLREIFGKFGLVGSVTRRGKASAVVVVATQHDAEKARTHMHNGWLDGRKLRVVADVAHAETTSHRTLPRRPITTERSSSLSPKGRNRRLGRLRSPISRNRNRSPLRGGRGRRVPSPFRGRSFDTKRRGTRSRSPGFRRRAPPSPFRSGRRSPLSPFRGARRRSPSPFRRRRSFSRSRSRSSSRSFSRSRSRTRGRSRSRTPSRSRSRSFSSRSRSRSRSSSRGRRRRSPSRSRSSRSRS